MQTVDLFERKTEIIKITGFIVFSLQMYVGQVRLSFVFMI